MRRQAIGWTEAARNAGRPQRYDFTTLNLPHQGRLHFANELLNRVRNIAGVEAAAIAEIVPLSGNGMAHDILMGDTGEPQGDAPVATFNCVSPDYSRTMRTAFLAGRDFDQRDAAHSGATCRPDFKSA